MNQPLSQAYAKASPVITEGETEEMRAPQLNGRDHLTAELCWF